MHNIMLGLLMVISWLAVSVLIFFVVRHIATSDRKQSGPSGRNDILDDDIFRGNEKRSD
jgi:hypothetical protein